MAERKHRSQTGKCNHQCAKQIIKCQLCGKSAGAMHLPSGCQLFANNKYLK